MSEKLVPRTKLWDDGLGPFIALECVCGAGVIYPGHPDEKDVAECTSCGQRWRAVDPDEVPDA